MNLHRRGILKAGAALSAMAVFPAKLWAEDAFLPQPGNWRHYQVTAKIEIQFGRPDQASVRRPAQAERSPRAGDPQ